MIPIFMLLEIKIGIRRNPTSRGCIPRICVLQCDVCGDRYERPYSKHYALEKTNRCSKKCVYGSRLTDGIGGHGAVVVERPCDDCGSLLKRLNWHETNGGKRWFCNAKCYGSWRAEHPETYAENTAKMHTPEAATKISASVRKRMQLPGYVHPWQGRNHSEKSKAMMSETCQVNPRIGVKNGMFGRKHSKESKEQMSDAVSQAFVAGARRPYGRNSKYGVYDSKRGPVSYRSSWELSVMIWLDKAPEVKCWEYERLRIPYVNNNNKRWYVPDFLVTFAVDHRELWEVKPKEFITSEKNVVKTRAAEAWRCENNVSRFRFITGDDMKDFT